MSPHNAGSTYGAGWGIVSEDVTVPSGAVAKCRRPGVAGLVAAGVIDNVDVLSSLVENKHIKRARGRGAQEKATVDTAALLADPEALGKMMRVVDLVTCYVVLEPVIFMAWRTNEETGKVEMIPQEDREKGIVYSDTVPEEDKMFLLNYGVGGTRDVERFRGELDENLRAVAHGQGISLPSV